MKPVFQREKKLITGDRLARVGLRFLTYIVIVAFLLIVGRIVVKGVPVLAKTGIGFLTKRPTMLVGFFDESGKYHRLTGEEFSEWKAAHPDELIFSKQTANYSGGGIFSPLVGTILLTLICMVVAISIGIAAALFLSESNKQDGFILTIRRGINSLAGVPSIVIGLFGYAFFCYFIPVITKNPPTERSFLSREIPDFFYKGFTPPGEQWYISFQGWGQSMIAAGLTLACMVLPTVIMSCEATIRSVPRGIRDAALALGSSPWQSIRKTVLPHVMPGMLAAAFLGMVRVAGETAPIMFTGAIAAGELPWVGLKETGFWRVTEFFQRGCEAMPYHIYTVAAKIPESTLSEDMQDGAVFVFMLVMMLLATISVILKMRFRKKMKW